ncbi:MAG: hypothetical protein PHD97_13330, partial [Bacteroidales bacterium]|nr:hypothetical protein [Bacteroidales bacterium]
MKKLFTILFSLMLSMTAFAQYDIPSWNMETWDSTLIYMPHSWDMMMGKFSHVKPAHGGNWACKMEGDPTQQNPGVLIDGNTQEGVVWFGGKPYTQKPDSVKIYIKYDIAIGDTAMVLFIFKKQGKAITDSTPKYLAWGTQTSNFEVKKFKINYLTSGTPDTVIFAIINSNYLHHADTLPWPNNSLIIDDITFTGTGITQQLPNNGFELWDSTMTYNLPGWYNEGQGGKPGLPPSFAMTIDKCEGQRAVLIQNYISSPDTVWGYMTTRKPGNNNGDHPAFKLTQPFNYNTLTFCYKYIPQNQDSMEISMGFYKTGMGGVGGSGFRDGATVNTYVERSMSLNYNPSQMPDSASMSLSAFVTKSDSGSK